jgi:hydroxyethylthiazole kinase-like uncharacterized protein yjeF
MQQLYTQTSSLDQRAIEIFALSEAIMMEHAAWAIADYITEHFARNSSILIVCGKGNNGSDGRILGRQLQDDYRISHLYDNTQSYDVIVDALFGSGLNRSLDIPTQELLKTLNSLDAFKIACDVPTGLFANGALDAHVFSADVTITMGALKRSLFSDAAKEITGEIFTANLGVARSRYEVDSNWKLLDVSDLRLPMRAHIANHKGSYGHLALICGEHVGAAVLAASAALRFGAGLVSLISNENLSLPYELMQCHSLRPTTSAVALGMGLGTEFDDDELLRLCDHTHPLVLDADIFYHPMFCELLRRPNSVLTPHPKEFTQILRATAVADIDVETLQNDRFIYVERFCAAYPHVTLLLKGANVIIGQNDQFFINPHGTVALAKGGSGDVLCGLIGALLAQGYSPLESAIQGSLAHTLSAKAFLKNNYSLTPHDIIEGIRSL